MLIYLSLFLWGICASYIYAHKKGREKKQHDVIYALSIILPIVLVSAFRGDVGTDTQRIYYPYFLNYIVGNNKYMGKEIGFLLFTRLTNKIYPSYSAFLFFIALLIWSVYYYTILHTKELKENYVLLFSGLFCIFFAPSLNIMRQSIACALIFGAYITIIQQNLKKFILILFIAMTFHTSAILFFPMYYIYYFLNDKYKTVKTVFIIVLCVAIIFLFPIMFQVMGHFELFEKYTTNYSGMVSFTMRWNKILVRLPLYISEIISFVIIRKKKIPDTRMLFYLVAIVIECASILFGFYMEWAFRLSYYFSLAHIFYWNYCVIELKSVRNKQVLSVYVILLYILYFIICHIRLGYDQIFPYAVSLS